MRNIDWVKEIDDSFVGSRIGPNNGKKYLQKDLANMFNVSRSCVGRIVLKKGWTHIHES